MKPLIKISNSELSYRLNLNYNNVYSRLRMKLGSKASLFADISTKSTGTTWYSDDDAEYIPLSEASKEETNNLIVALNDAVSAVRNELKDTPELADYVDDILEIPSNDFVFYRKSGEGYKLILAGWGCKYAHQSANDPNSGFIKRLAKKMEATDVPIEKSLKQDIGSILADIQEKDFKSDSTINNQESADIKQQDTAKPMGEKVENTDVKPQEVKPQGAMPKKTQHVVVRVLDQTNSPIEGEDVIINASTGSTNATSSEKGLVEVGDLPYGETFNISFPNLTGNPERTFEVEKNVETYDAFVKKFAKYTPVLFIEDQNNSTVQDYNVKIVIKGQETVYNSGQDGVIQLPTMLEGQKFVVIDTANYANTEEYSVTQAEAKAPYHFHVKSAEKAKVGITVLNVSGKPIPKASVSLQIGETPCQQITDEKGRAEFPGEFFVPGIIPVNLSIKGTGLVKSNLKYQQEISEYTIQLRGEKHGFDWRWLGLLPLVALLGWGGYTLYEKLLHKAPTIAEMESGVCLILGQGYYYVDLKVSDVKIDDHPAVAYFNYDENEREISNLTFDPEEAKVQAWWGTGFLISDDGLIATNRHVASPIAPQEVAQDLKKYFQDRKDFFQKNADRLNDKLQILGGMGLMTSKLYSDSRDTLLYCKDQVRYWDKLINTGDFVVKMKCVTSVAFTNSQIENENDFIACSQPKAVGDPGGVKEKDLAIIQIKKKQDIPKDAFVFSIPEKDLMDGDIPDNYEITVLGYNAGGNIQDMNLQDGIKPQAQHGRIANRSEKYRVGYDASTIGGSSGSPVINNDGQLVAINNSNLRQAQGFAYGVRTKYLKELLDEVKKKTSNNN